MESSIGRLEMQLSAGQMDACPILWDLVDRTRMVVQVIEEILRNEARVVLDISGVTTFDNVGLEGALTRGHRAIFRRNSRDWRWDMQRRRGVSFEQNNAPENPCGLAGGNHVR
jgi:hypothetical protein